MKTPKTFNMTVSKVWNVYFEKYVYINKDTFNIINLHKIYIVLQNMNLYTGLEIR